MTAVGAHSLVIEIKAVTLDYFRGAVASHTAVEMVDVGFPGVTQMDTVLVCGVGIVKSKCHDLLTPAASIDRIRVMEPLGTRRKCRSLVDKYAPEKGFRVGGVLMCRGPVCIDILRAFVFIRIKAGTHKRFAVFYVFAGNVGAEADPGRINAVCRDPFIEIVGIQPDSDLHLFQIVDALGAHSRLFCLVQCRQQHSRQDRDDRNHDEELYQRKAALSPE